MKRFVVGIGLLVALALLVTATATAAKPPPAADNPPLTGESFAGIITSVSNLNCNSGDPSSSYSFDATGIANGPYAGTFTEHVAVTQTNQGIQPLVVTFSATDTALTFNENFGTLSQITAAFEITSPTGTVTGTKTLVSDVGSLALCSSSADLTVLGNASGSVPAEVIFTQGGTLTYNATITTVAGQSQDSGTATLNAEQLKAAGFLANPGFFQESFTSGVVQPPPGGPGNSPGTQNGKGCGDTNHAHTRTDQCKP